MYMKKLCIACLKYVRLVLWPMKRDIQRIMVLKYFIEIMDQRCATPVLLVHGLGAQLVHWPEHLIDFLIENNYRPITFDNRDSGLSTRFIKETINCFRLPKIFF